MFGPPRFALLNRNQKSHKQNSATSSESHRAVSSRSMIEISARRRVEMVAGRIVWNRSVFFEQCRGELRRKPCTAASITRREADRGSQTSSPRGFEPPRRQVVPDIIEVRSSSSMMLKSTTSCPRCLSSLRPLNSPFRGTNMSEISHDHSALSCWSATCARICDVGLLRGPGFSASDAASTRKARALVVPQSCSRRDDRTAPPNRQLVRPTESQCWRSKYTPWRAATRKRKTRIRCLVRARGGRTAIDSLFF